MAARRSRLVVPTDVDQATLLVDGRSVQLTNLRKPFWSALGVTKGALIQYYADVSELLQPHVRDGATLPSARGRTELRNWV